MKALSIRQPWAWLIVSGYKDIENRSWSTRFRGRVFVHAAKGMTIKEYKDVAEFLLEHRLIDAYNALPRFDDLLRGGIVGAVDIVDCVSESKSPWFFGKYGFVLENAREHDFLPCKGQLGFFEVQYG